MLNRSAVAISPKQSSLDWLNYVEGDKTFTLGEMNKTHYLVPGSEEPGDADKILRILMMWICSNLPTTPRLLKVH